MAHIAQRSNGNWRAEVNRSGERFSRSDFADRQEAEAWAAQQEARIAARRQASKALKTATFGASVPRRLLQARAGLPIPESEIVQHAIPATALCGVYFLIQRAEVVYVGQSLNVFARLAQHLKGQRIAFDSFNAVACAPEELNSLEAHYIAALTPRHNTSFGGVRLPEPEGQPAPYRTNADDAKENGGRPWWKRAAL